MELTEVSLPLHRLFVALFSSLNPSRPISDVSVHPGWMHINGYRQKAVGA